MSCLNQQSVLVTGGAMGIGRLMAERAVRDGARRVVIWDINAATLEETAAALRGMGQAQVDAQVVDVSDTAAIEAAAEETLAGGRVDVVFNNAGIVVGKAFSENTRADIDRTIAINVLGVMHVARVFLPGMIERRKGHLVNIASAASYVPVPRGAVYAASKWAVHGWSESVRIELEQIRSGVKVTTICPSYINTGMFDGVKAPLLTPILEPHDVVNRIVAAMDRNAAVARMPWIVNITPFLKGVLPVRAFDWIAGEVFGVYTSMDRFKGRGK